MAELYHMHTRGIRDDKWKEKKEIVINDSFVNRLGKKCNEFNDCIPCQDFSDICKNINLFLNCYGYESIEGSMPIHKILEYILHNEHLTDKKTLINLLSEIKKFSFNSSVFKREMAMEQYRKDHNSNLPSRLNCLYATTEEGIAYWSERLLDGDMDIYRIEAIEEPFKTSEIFIPDVNGSYKNVYTSSHHYWNPKFKSIDEGSIEYLIKGKVKILEKVGEIKKTKF